MTGQAQARIVRTLLAWGAHGAAFVAVKDMDFEEDFRALCEQNSCGMYGNCLLYTSRCV